MAIYQCPDCAYQYDEAQGDQHQGYPPGMPFADLPDDFACPACYVQEKAEFVLVEQGC